MRNLTRFLATLCAFHVLSSGVASAQTSYPMITHTYPVAIQRGKTTEITVEGQMNFAGIYKVLFDRPGLTAEVLETPPPTAPKAPKTAKTNNPKRMQVQGVRSVGLKVS